MRMADMKFYSHLNTQQKRGLRKVLESVNNHTKRQIEHLENSIIKVLKERINNSVKVLKNEIPIEHYQKRNKYLTKYIQDFFGTLKNMKMFDKFKAR